MTTHVRVFVVRPGGLDIVELDSASLAIVPSLGGAQPVEVVGDVLYLNPALVAAVLTETRA